MKNERAVAGHNTTLGELAEAVISACAAYVDAFHDATIFATTVAVVVDAATVALVSPAHTMLNMSLVSIVPPTVMGMTFCSACAAPVHILVAMI